MARCVNDYTQCHLRLMGGFQDSPKSIGRSEAEAGWHLASRIHLYLNNYVANYIFIVIYLASTGFDAMSDFSS